MHDDPGLEDGRIAACLAANYGIDLASVAFLPVTSDPGAAAYRVTATNGAQWFLKVTFGPLGLPGLLVPTALVERGIPNVLAPARTRSGPLACLLDGHADRGVVLFPFIGGHNAKVAGMSDAQWRTFGATLRAIHGSKVGDEIGAVLAVEGFDLPSAALVRRTLATVANDETRSHSPAGIRLAAFLRTSQDAIRRLLARAEELGGRLQTRPFEKVLCHGDIHSANVLVAADGRIFLVDWDGPPEPLLAPRERDLLFIVGSRIGRPVLPREQDLFFDGYGEVAVDPMAIAYFRYERIIQDFGAIADGVFHDGSLSEEARAAGVALVMRFFEPDGDIEVAERNAGRGG